MSNRPVDQSVGQERDEELEDGVPQSERIITSVLQHILVSFFMYQHSDGGFPECGDYLELQADVI